ncbi:MAG TPA: Hsp20/alpha crystallin family protein [Candidatus Dormibacteraeota bacterium]|jgi:HSP20 family protein
MDRLFGDIAENSANSGGTDLATFRLPVDIAETDSGYVIKAPVPGFKPDEVEVSLSDGVLSIKAEHKEEKTERKKNYLRREVAYGNFERMIALPNDVRGDDIKAAFKNGVLQIEVPRAPKPQPKKIQVRAEDQEQQGHKQMTAVGNNSKT